MKNAIYWPGNLQNDCDKAVLIRGGEVVAVQYSNGNIIAFPSSKEENGKSIGIDFPANTETKAPELNFLGKGKLTLDDFIVYHIDCATLLCVANGWWPVVNGTQIVYRQDNKWNPETWPRNFPTGNDLAIVYFNEAAVVAIQQNNYDYLLSDHPNNLTNFTEVSIKNSKPIEILHIETKPESFNPWAGWPPHNPNTCWGYC